MSNTHIYKTHAQEGLWLINNAISLEDYKKACELFAYYHAEFKRIIDADKVI